ncbi:hypothetical protein AVEN_96224-1 [Araneus ventricosus]|uniref:Uncharacterized protein n=1 Tax=Araneus ventricosus TaxID=182803 RepID=A0A4Y2V637_ARAVE|nr:hypothetical protein AVEN_96224-1 [Araneus ventricosus]
MSLLYLKKPQSHRLKQDPVRESSRHDRNMMIVVVLSVHFGNYESVVLNGGESTTISFDKPIVPHGKGFCVVLKFRKGPLDAANRDQSSFKALFGMDYGSSSQKTISSGSTSFKDYRINIKWGTKTKLSFSFSVPSGAPSHILDIREIMAFDGRCDTRSDYK